MRLDKHISVKGLPVCDPACERCKFLQGVDGAMSDASTYEDKDGLKGLSESLGKINRLTDREQEVLYCLIKGMSDGDIGKALKIGVNGVQKHVQSIRKKMKVKRRTDILLLVIDILRGARIL